jgi:mRNA interferase RelE/StbE
MPFTVELKRSAEKELQSLPAKVHDRITRALLTLKDNPFPHNAKKLHGRQGIRVRVGKYRILYVVHSAEKRIEGFSVADRKDVYRF